MYENPEREQCQPDEPALPYDPALDEDALPVPGEDENAPAPVFPGPEEAEAEGEEEPKPRMLAPMMAGTEPTTEISHGTFPENKMDVFSAGIAGNDSVELASGSLKHTVTDFVLPGKNGFDLAIAREYNSAEAYDQYVDACFVREINQTAGTEKLIITPATQFLGHFGFGCGWRLVLPSVELRGNVYEVGEGANKKTHDIRTTVIQLEDGRKLTVDKDGKLVDSPLQDVVFSKSGGTVKHPVTQGTKNYNYSLTYKDGRKDYFAEVTVSTPLVTGGKIRRGAHLVARQDRFGNTLLFTHTEYHTVDAGGKVIGFPSQLQKLTIIDTWGRTVTLTRSGKTYVWALPGGNKIIYGLDNESTDYQKRNRLVSVTNEAGLVTMYAYAPTTQTRVQASYVKTGHKDLAPGAATNFAITFDLLKNVTYPSGAKAEYTYGAAVAQTINDKYEGTWRFYPIATRQDVAGGTVYNAESYSFTLAADKKYFGKAQVKKPNGVSETHNFNSKSQLVSNEVYHGTVRVMLGKYTYGTDKTKPDYRQLLKEDVCRYALRYPTRSLQKLTGYTYSTDKRVNITKIVEEYPFSPALNRTTHMAYGKHSLLTEKRYHKDSGTVIKEAYTLHTNGLVVEYARVYENDVLREKTRYLYGAATHPDAAHCVTEEQRFWAQPGESLEASTRTVRTLNTYDAAQCVHSPVVVKIIGVKDADGKATSDVAQSFRYDVWGRVIYKSQPGAIATDIAYDRLGRVTKITHPPVNGVRHTQFCSYDDQTPAITVWNENGHKTKTVYTKLGQPKEEYLVEYNGDVLVGRQTYDNTGRLTREETFGPGNTRRTTTLYTYDSFDRVLQKTIPETGYAETHVYHDICALPGKSGYFYDGHQVTVHGCGTAPSVVSTSYTDFLGRPVEEHLAGARVAAAAYDKLGNAITKVDAMGQVTRCTYDYAGNLLTATQTLKGEGGATTPVVTRAAYDSLGNKCFVWDPAGNQSTFSYDAAGRLVKQQTPFDETQTAVVKNYYDARGNLVEQKTWQGQYWRRAAYSYDTRGRQTAATLYEDEAGTRYSRSETLYDGVGNKTELRTGITHAVKRYSATRFAYGRFGNVVRITDALGHSATSSYDATGLLLAKKNRNGTQTTYTYDAAGRPVREVTTAERPDGSGDMVQKTYTYTRNGKTAALRTTTQSMGQAATTQVIEYLYNNKGQLIRQKDPGDVTKLYTYDAAGRRTSFTMHTRDGAITAAGYDALALTAAQYEARDLTARQYDLYAKPLLEQPDETRLTAAEYDTLALTAREFEGATLTAFAYDTNGKPLLVPGTGLPLKTHRPAVCLRLYYQYDNLGRLTGVRRLSANGPVLARYGYDINGNRQSLACPEKGIETRYSYNAANQPVAVTTRQNGQVLQDWRYTYTPDGNQKSKANFAAGGPLTAAEYDALNLTAQSYESAGLTALAYDTNAKPLLGGQAATAPVTLYEYDGFGRLVREEVAGGPTTRYSFDRFHNRAAMRVTGGPEGDATTTYLYDANNRLLTETRQTQAATTHTQYFYDRCGNQTAKAQVEDASLTAAAYDALALTAEAYDAAALTASDYDLCGQKLLRGQSAGVVPLAKYHYNGPGQLIAVEMPGQNVVYCYRPDGMRHQKSITNTATGATRQTTHHWDGGNIVMDAVNGAIEALFLRGIGLVAMQLRDNAQAEGERQYYLPGAHDDVVGMVTAEGLQTFEYDAYGNPIGDVPAGLNPFRYCGEYFDEETGEIYLRARYYNPANGRFGASDPIRDGLNWYTYCASNPIRFIDPSGLALADIWLGEVDSKGNQRGSALYRKDVGSAYWYQNPAQRPVINAVSQIVHGGGSARPSSRPSGGGGKSSGGGGRSSSGFTTPSITYAVETSNPYMISETYPGTLPYPGTGVGAPVVADPYTGVVMLLSILVGGLVDAQAKEEVRREDTIIYRGGGNNPGNLVPRPFESALSYRTKPLPTWKEYTVTTVGAVQSTGELLAVVDYQNPDSSWHVSIMPVDDSTLQEWKSSKEQGYVHRYTAHLQHVSQKVKNPLFMKGGGR